MTYYLCSNPSVLDTLTQLIRSSYTTAAEITMATIGCNEYLGAVLCEGLRLFPPQPGNMRRLTPQKGMEIADVWIHGGVLVAVDQYSANLSPRNFWRPKEFVPQRWINEPPEEFENDKLKAAQPFGVGPRNCMGRSLALMCVVCPPPCGFLWWKGK